MKMKRSKLISCLIAVLFSVFTIISVTPARFASADVDGYYWPVPASRQINTYYSSSHDGLDIGGTIGMDVCAVRSGTVVGAFTGDVAGKWYGYGNGVVIDHGNGYYSHYAHLNSYCVSSGQWVEQGQKIGELGTTGNSTGPHLHFAYATSMYGSGGRVNVNPDSFSYIYELAPTPSKPTLTVNAGNSETNTVLTWTACSDTEWYDIRIYIYETETDYKTLFGYKDGTTYSIVLPAGKYFANIASVNSHDKFTFSDSVVFTVEEAPVKGDLLVTPDAGTGKTNFKWTLDGNAKSVVLKITDLGTSESLELTKTAELNSAVTALEDGNYRAVLNAVRENGSKQTIDTVDFVVGGAQTWTYCSAVPKENDPDLTITEYKNRYEKLGVESPGKDWHDNGVAKTMWENTGGVYTNKDYPLETSDARVCVKEYFYHYCIPGGSFPCECNYEKTSRFSSYDEIVMPNADMNVYDQGDDEGHPYYLAKTQAGNKVVCGNGGQVWYKAYDYQNRVKVEQHKYTKESEWTDLMDPDASSYQFRYRSITDVEGDVNCDGSFTVSDLVLLQKWLLADPDAKLSNWQAGDLCNDGRLDIFDLCSMRKLLTK